MKKRKVNWSKLIIMLIIVSIVAMVTFVLYELFHVTEYETTSIEEIGNYKGTMYYDMALFPTEKIEKEKVVKYKYIYKGNILDDSQYVMLVYQYGDDYENAKERLSTIKNEYGIVTYNKTKFNLPAYIYLYKLGDNSEFALLDDEKKQITYMFIQCPFDFEEESYVD